MSFFIPLIWNNYFPNTHFHILLASTPKFRLALRPTIPRAFLVAQYVISKPLASTSPLNLFNTRSVRAGCVTYQPLIPTVAGGPFPERKATRMLGDHPSHLMSKSRKRGFTSTSFTPVQDFTIWHRWNFILTPLNARWTEIRTFPFYSFRSAPKSLSKQSSKKIDFRSSSTCHVWHHTRARTHTHTHAHTETYINTDETDREHDIQNRITTKCTPRAELVPKLPSLPCPRFHLSCRDVGDFNLQVKHQKSTSQSNQCGTTIIQKKKDVIWAYFQVVHGLQNREGM